MRRKFFSFVLLLSAIGYCLGASGQNCNYDSCSWDLSNNWQWGEVSGDLNKRDPLDGIFDQNHFLFVNAKKDAETSVVATAASPAMTDSSCLSFYYHIFGEDAGQLNIYTYFNGQKALFWQTNGSHVDKWHFVQRRISGRGSESYQFEFEAIPNKEVSGQISINLLDINRKCGDQADSCNFELSSCSWESISYKYPWKRTSPSSNPAFDHTYGTRFGHLIKSDLSKSGKETTTRLTNLINDYRQHKCLEFWYYLPDNAIGGDLVVYTQYYIFDIESVIWKNPDFYDNNWRQGRVSIRKRKDAYSIIFEAVKKDGGVSTGTIALDDVSIKPGKCQSQFTCNFNDNLCGYYNSHLSSKILLGRGRVQDYNLLKLEPPHDPFYPNGMYAYFDGTATQSENQEAALNSAFMKVTTDSCLIFSYYMAGTDPGTLSLRKLSYKYQQTNITIVNEEVWSTKESTNSWTSESQLLKAGQYQLQFSIERGSNPQSFIAFNDIDVLEGDCPDLKNSKCDFENKDLCSWTTDASWVVRQAKEALTTKEGPAFDRLQNPHGYYAYFKPTNNNKIGYLKSINLSGTFCFKFWYFMSSPEPITLELLKSESANQNTSIWKKYGTQNDGWNLGSLNIEAKTPVSLIFLATQFTANVGEIALDDLGYSLGSCPHLKDTLCDFESEDLCGYHIEGEWYRKNGIDNEGPLVDHTFDSQEGYYMYTEKSASLTSPHIQATLGSCLNFWYLIGGDDSATLMVYSQRIDNEKVMAASSWSLEAERLNGTWMYGSMSLKSPTVFNISFEAAISKSKEDLSYIALDDIIIKKNDCPPPGTCNFELGLCSWTNPQSNILQWTRNKGPTPTNGTGPSEDNTLKTLYGSYAYLSGKNSLNFQDPKGILQSEVLKPKKDQCFSLWYHMYGAQMGSLSVNTTALKDMANLTQSKLILGNQNNEWHELLFNLSKSDLKNDYVININGLPNGELSDIAVDDIAISDGLCPIPREELFKCAQNDQTIHKSQVCDFNEDCADGEDERHCGTSCDFETDQCNWYDIKNICQRVQAKDLYQKNKNWPATDHTNTSHSEGWYMDLIKQTVGYQGNTFQSPGEPFQFKKSSTSCIFKFWFYINGRSSSSILIKKTKLPSSKTTLWKMTFHESNIWTEGLAMIGKTSEEFYVEIVSSASYATGAMIAVDDISFENCNAPPPSNSCLSDDQFHCPRTKVCIDKSMFCDGQDDCGDNYEESEAFCQDFPKMCTFEDGSDCEWLTKYEDKAVQWQKKQIYTTSIYKTGPLQDHTIGLDDRGTYLEIRWQIKSDYNLKSWYYSPMIKPNPNCHLRFYYYLYGKDIGSLKVYKIEDKKKIWIELLGVSGDVGQFWKRAIVNPESRVPFFFIIEGNPGTDSANTIALDDLSLSKECELLDSSFPPVFPENDVCPQDQFQCTNSKCISLTKACDFTLDCPDGLDERNCGPCNFEEDFCGWTVEGDGKLKWQRTKAGTNPKIPTDHTNKKINEGYYANVYVDTKGLTESSFDSPTLPQTSTNCRVKFWLFVDGRTLKLSFYFKKPKSTSSVYLTSITNHTLERWAEHTVQLPLSHKGGYLQLNVDSKYRPSKRRDFAMDDITFENCDAKRFLIDCDFDEDWCFWNAGTEEVKWERHQGSTLSHLSGPSADHTTGYGSYIFVDQKKIGPDKTVNFSSPLILPKSNNTTCFSLWYYMQGPNIGTLKFLTKPFTLEESDSKVIWEHSGSQEGWKYLGFSLESSATFQIIISVLTTEGDHGDIAIDDIKLAEGECHRAHFCNFEDDFCDWKNEGSLPWERVKGALDGTRPNVDHTTSLKIGHFLYIPSNSSLNQKADLRSPPFNRNYGENCLQLWYNMLGNDIGTLGIHQHFGTLIFPNPLWIKVSDHLGIWKKGKATIANGKNYSLVIRAVKGMGTSGYIAIDDLQLSNSPCSSLISCNFELDFCGWSTDQEKSSVYWVRTSYEESGGSSPNPILPKSHYLYASFKGQKKNAMAILISEDIPYDPKIETYCLSFDYNLFNNNDFIVNVDQNQFTNVTSSIINFVGSTYEQNKWLRFEDNIPKPKHKAYFYLTFSVLLNGRAQLTKESGFALDNLKFSPHACGVQPPTLPPPTPTPLLHKTPYDCDFEEDCPMWQIQVPKNKFIITWQAQQGHNNISNISPRTDHTTLSTNGRFLELRRPYTSEEDAIFLTKKTRQITAKGTCVKFWFYINGNNMKSFLEFSTRNESEILLHWKQTGSLGPFWNYEQIFLDEVGEYQMEFRANTGKEHSIALDDISFSDGLCPMRKLCTVEQDECGFTSDIKADFNWIRGNNQTTFPFGPPHDHSTLTNLGKYFCINSSKAKSSGEKAILKTAELTSETCLKFWYYQSIEKPHTLAVNIKYEETLITLWTSNKGDNKWLPAQIKLDQLPLYPFQYVFEATTSAWSLDSKLALDDIAMFSTCDSFISCNFEKDTCLWTNTINSSIFWSRSSGEVTVVGPSRDHTYNTTFGNYIYIHEEDIDENKLAFLISPYIPFEKPSCFSFYYFLNGTNMPELELYAVPHLSDPILLKHMANEQKGTWNLGQIFLNNISYGDEFFRLQFNGKLHKNRQQFIALDDFELSEGDCPDIAPQVCKYRCNNNTVCVTENKLCDFYADCADGSDEENCGTICDFEQDLCSWEKQGVKNQWELYRVNDTKPPPMTDRTHLQLNKGQYIACKINGLFPVYRSDLISSPHLHQAFGTCRFLFWYYIDFGNRDRGKLHVQINQNDDQPVVIFSLAKSQPEEWHLAETNVGRVNGQFRVSFNGEPNFYNGVMAIDDIHFEDCALPRSEETSETCDGFKCANGICIPKNQQCDYNDDCGDYSDENPLTAGCREFSGRCDFEHDLCEWQNYWRDDKHSKWIIEKASIAYSDSVYPRDHTLNSIHGHFLRSTFKWNEIGGRVILESPTMIQTDPDKPCWFNFYYTYSTKFEHYRFKEYTGIGPLAVYIQQDVNSEWELKWTTVEIPGFYFERKSLQLDPMEGPFQVLIQAVIGTDSAGRWLIDDVSFSKDCSYTNESLPLERNITIPTIPPSVCSKTEFACNSKCISKDKVCNFAFDCEDKSDEQKICAACEFNQNQTPLCGWQDASSGAYKWSRMENQNNNFYIGITKSHDGISTKEAVFKSTKHQKTIGSCEIVFSYFLNSTFADSTTLYLTLRSETILEPVILWKEDSHTIDWQQVTVSLESREAGWWLELIAQHGLDKGFVGFKNVSFLNCAPPSSINCKDNQFKCEDGFCIDHSLRCDYSFDCMDGSDEINCSNYLERCDFESPCNWKSDDNSALKWIIFSGKSYSEDTGPSRDHTYGNSSGHYLYLSSISQQTKGKSARQISTRFLSTIKTKKCAIRFWYHMHGEHISNLKVHSKVAGASTVMNLLQELSGSKGDEWHRTSIPIESLLDFEIVLEGFRGDGAKDEIAIDDISFTPECIPAYTITPTPKPTVQPASVCNITTQFICDDNSCIKKEYVCDFKADCPDGEDERSCLSACDFEVNLCGWRINKTSSSSNWEIVGNTTSISRDHTLNSTKGHFLNYWITNFKSGLPNPTLVGPPFKAAKSSCKFSFWYLLNAFDKKIQVLLNTSESSLLLFEKFPHVYNNEWRQFTVGIGQQYKDFNIYLEIDSKFGTNNYFAIDDIEFSECGFPKKAATCPLKGYFKCHKTDACIEKYHECDLNDDCGDGSDEADCDANLQMSFDTGLSPFQLVKSEADNDRNWKMASGTYSRRYKDTTGPLFDHTRANSKGTYLYFTSEIAGEKSYPAQLLSPIIQAANGQNCSLRFYYYTFGVDVNSLDVYIQFTEPNDAPQPAIWKIKGTGKSEDPGNDFWQRANINLNSYTKPFKLRFVAQPGFGKSDVIAIDDIIFTSGCWYKQGALPSPPPIETTTTSTTTPSFTCNKDQIVCNPEKKCLPKSYQCDFDKDCSDNSDEANCVQSTCDFGKDLCGWKIEDVIKQRKIEADNPDWRTFKWNVISADDDYHYNKDLRPKFDHASNSTKGKYLIVDGTPGKRSDYTDFNSPTIPATGPHCIFEFWLFCSKYNGCPLEIYIESATKPKYDIWRLDNQNVANSWQLAQISLSHFDNFKINFHAVKGKTSQFAVSVDDLAFKNCTPVKPPPTKDHSCDKDKQFTCHDSKACIDKSRVCDYAFDCGMDDLSDEMRCDHYTARCDFDHGLCFHSWHYEEYQDSLAIVSPSTSFSTANEPITDHTQYGPKGKMLKFALFLPSTVNKYARLSSIFIKGATTSDCRIRFWTIMRGENSFIQVYRRFSLGEMELVATVTRRYSGDIWDKSDIVVSKSGSSTDYEVMLQFNTQRSGKIYLDDISLTPSCEPSSKPPLDPNSPTPIPHHCEELMCENKNCYKHYQRCNFYDDCGDNSDEKDCGTSCDFETDLCGWFNPPDLASRWEITSYQSGSNKNYPKQDHTYKNQTGHYILPKHNWYRVDSIAHLHSKMYTSSSSHCTIIFWHHMGSKDGELALKIKTVDKSEKVRELWSDKSMQSESWERVEVKLGAQNNFSLLFQARHGSGGMGNSIVALDDIEYSNCGPDTPITGCASDEHQCISNNFCIKRYLVCDGFEDCADGSDEMSCESVLMDCKFDMDFCDWDNKNDQWKRAASSKKECTGPKMANGHYAFIDSSSMAPNDVAILQSPVMEKQARDCFVRFWYYKKGSDQMGKLEVIIVTGKTEHSIFETSGPDERPMWKRQILRLDHPHEYNVVFAASGGNDDCSDIAINDISFTPTCIVGSPITPPPTENCPSQFECQNGACISKNWVCDCLMDCKDGSDELDCPNCESPCGPKEFDCELGTPRCINKRLVCDGVSDCLNGKDEDYCHSETCKQDMYYCVDHLHPCLAREELCNTHYNCSDGSDESLCDMCLEDLCLNNGTCTLSKRVPVCNCTEEFEGNRCNLEVQRPDAKSPKEEKFWIIAVFAGIIFIVAAIYGLYYYWKQRTVVPSVIIAGINNPIYGNVLPMQIETEDERQFAESSFSSFPASLANSTAFDNPLYEDEAKEKQK